MDNDKVKFIKETSVKLLAAYLVEDRIAWYKDMSCFGCDTEALVNSSIDSAELLWDKLKEKGYYE